MGMVELDGATNGVEMPDGLPRLGNVDALGEILKDSGNGGCLVAVPADSYARVAAQCEFNLSNGVAECTVLYPGAKPEAESVFSPGQTRFSWLYDWFKRGLDLVLAPLFVAVAAPLIGLIALLIKLDSRGPVFYAQTRVGRDGHLFKMHKFRSMRRDADSALTDLKDVNEASGLMFKISDDPRVTRVGQIIRRLSLDELPQLFDVIRGSMSIVGPRPPLPEEVAEYDPRHFRRLEAKPGITGLWQVRRGADVSFDDMFQLDLEYMDTWSIWLEAEILLKTVPAMLQGRGAY